MRTFGAYVLLIQLRAERPEEDDNAQLMDLLVS